MFFSRAGMRLSSLAAVEEFVPPRARHCAGLVGGAVGNAVTVELLETFSVAGRAVAFDAFAWCLRHGYESPGMWGPSIVRPMGRGGWRFDLCREIFTPARRNVRSDGTIVLGFGGDVKGFLGVLIFCAERAPH